MGGLDAAQGLDNEDAMMGGLSQQPEPDFADATARLRAHAALLPPDGVSSLSRTLNPPSQRAIQYETELKNQIERSRQESLAAKEWMMHPPINEGLPWLRFGAGMLAPTMTGSGAEGLSHGISGLASGLEENQKQRLDLGKAGMQQGVTTETNAFNEYGRMSQLSEQARHNDMLIQKARQALLLTPGVKDFLANHGDRVTIEDIEKGTVPADLKDELKQAIGMTRGNGITKQAIAAGFTPGTPEYANQIRAMAAAPIERIINQRLAQNVYTNPKDRERDFNRMKDELTGKIAANPALVDQLEDPQAAQTLLAPSAPVQQAAPQSGAPAGAVLSKGSPELAAQTESQKKYAEGEYQYNEGLMNAARTAYSGNRQLDELQTAINSPASRPGMLSAVLGAISKFRVAAGVGTQQDIERAKEFETADKVVSALATNVVKNITARPTQAEFMLTRSKSVPNMGMTPAAANYVINLMRQTNNLALEENKGYAGYKKENPSGNFLDFQRDFLDKAIQSPLAAQVSSGTLPAGLPSDKGYHHHGNISEGGKDFQIWVDKDGKNPMKVE